MLQSRLLTKTSKTDPKDEEFASAKLLIRAGFIKKSSAGVYSYLPLALRVLGKISAIVREEMNAIGGQELLMPTLIAKKYYQKTGRWDIPIVYTIQTPQKDEYALGWTHEEIIAHIAQDYIQSEKDLPKYAYQIQTKFRLEPRARGGLIRCREFLMKDLYSFHKNEEDLEEYYWKVSESYKKIFHRIGLPTTIVEAAGGDFTKQYTHEFQVLVESGEDTIYHCESCEFARNKEIAGMEEGDSCPVKKCSGAIRVSRGIEVGNIFRLGKRYSPWVMGSYGLGISRTLSALIEVLHDDRGMIWPKSVAPYHVHLIHLGTSSAKDVYDALSKKGIEVLYDDRDVSSGTKLFDADLIGLPWRMVVSDTTGNKIEIKERSSKTVKIVTLKEAIALVSRV